jgi:hypothetical protein
MAGSPSLRALPDFANSLMGGDEVFNAQAVKAMFARAWNIAHVKDAEMIHRKRESVSLAELFGLAKQAGYRGVLLHGVGLRAGSLPRHQTPDRADT